MYPWTWPSTTEAFFFNVAMFLNHVDVSGKDDLFQCTI